jgi:hypothetical protein
MLFHRCVAAVRSGWMYAAVVLLLLSTWASAHIALARAENKVATIVQQEDVYTDRLEATRSFVFKEHSSLQGYLLSGDPALRRSFTIESRSQPEALTGHERPVFASQTRWDVSILNTRANAWEA